MHASKGYVRAFITAYIDCALWSSTDNADDSGGEPLDSNYSTDDLDERARQGMAKDCVDFIRENWSEIYDLDAGQCGHDFWLTRNGHGAGFWDRGLGELGNYLTKQSKPYGSCDLYVGDDGKIYAA